MKALIDFGKRMVDIVQVNINEDNVVRLRVKYYDARDGGFIANRWVDLKEIEITPAIGTTGRKGARPGGPNTRRT